MTDEELGPLASRRDFFKKMLALGFAVPVISSFALEGVASADQSGIFVPNSTKGDQFCVNQSIGNQDYQFWFNQAIGNQDYQFWFNQAIGNQPYGPPPGHRHHKYLWG